MVDQESGSRPSSFSVGGDLSMRGSNFAGGDQHIGDNVRGDKVGRDKITRNNIRLRFGLGLLALVLVGGGGYLAVKRITADPTDVVYEEGLDGAAHTATAIKQAEVDGNAKDWCFLASAQSGGTCTTMMSAAFTSRPDLRAEIPEVELGAASGSGNSAQVDVSFHGAKVGVAPLSWNGERWELQSAFYMVSINNGGLAFTAVLNSHGCGVLLGTITGCDT
ncbi:hypothetical protein [Actinophytocola sp.]|uniref:hypothetical protein n=1 Tax=Actinophytocola sp. TaxID=1872138 RepID=UPI003899DA71